jgi:hypothetical protein
MVREMATILSVLENTSKAWFRTSQFGWQPVSEMNKGGKREGNLLSRTLLYFLTFPGRYIQFLSYLVASRLCEKPQYEGVCGEISSEVGSCHTSAAQQSLGF